MPLSDYDRGYHDGLQKAWRFVQEEHEDRIARHCSAGYNATGIIKLNIEHEIAKKPVSRPGNAGPIQS